MLLPPPAWRGLLYWLPRQHNTYYCNELKLQIPPPPAAPVCHELEVPTPGCDGLQPHPSFLTAALFDTHVRVTVPWGRCAELLNVRLSGVTSRRENGSLNLNPCGPCRGQRSSAALLCSMVLSGKTEGVLSAFGIASISSSSLFGPVL